MKRLARGAGNVLGRVSGRVSDLVKTLGGVVVIGSPVYIGGCGVGAYSKDPKAGVMVDSLLQGLWQAEVAREGRSEVNVNVGGQMTLTDEEMNEIKGRAISNALSEKSILDDFARKLAYNPEKWIHQLHPSVVRELWPQALKYNPNLEKHYSIPEG